VCSSDLRYTVKETLSEARQARTHAFSCMFYSRLTADRAGGHEAGHSLVARWTKSLDLFDRDFVLIPINYSYHWSLAVIVRPFAMLVSAAGVPLYIRIYCDYTLHTALRMFCQEKLEVIYKGDFADLLSSPPQSQGRSGSSSRKGKAQPAGNGASLDLTEEAGSRQLKPPEHTAVPKRLFSEAGEGTEGAGNGSPHISVSSSPSPSSSSTQQQEQERGVGPADDDENLTCILHMDSLGMHGTANIGRVLKK
jgi:Ulp1 family protease